MNSIIALNIVRDNLRTNLTDLYSLAGGEARDGSLFIFGDEPVTNHKYPQIQLLKSNNPSEPITIGPAYTEYEQLFINIWVYSKNGFKITVSGTEYKNAEIIEYYLGLIKTTLKAQFNTLFSNGAKMYKHINTTNIIYNEREQLYTGAVTIRVAYFNK